MKLDDILDIGRVVYRLQATTRDDVLHELVHRGFVQRECNTELGIADEERIVSVLIERERTFSTGIKDGLAIPHGKLERLDTVLAAVGISEVGVDFGAPDGKKSHVFVALLAPESGVGLHLKALARIARIFSSPGLLDRLLQAPDEHGIYRILLDEDARLA
jgi:PTS system nitrogen regulatory IIA component